MAALIIDSNFLGYRARYALPRLSYNDMGTAIVFGFLSHVLSLAKYFKTNDIIFCWDSKYSKRRKMFKGYKDRKRSDSDGKERKIIYKQFKKLRREILPEIGFSNVFVQKWYEADDIIAALAIGKLGDFIIVSSDEDLYQLLSINTKIWNPTKHKMTTHSSFMAKYGIHPTFWSGLKSLAGCSSDTIPGVEGIGEKKALQFLKGEMNTKSKLYKRLTDPANVKKAHEFQKLTRLPLEGTKEPKLKPNQFSVSGFKEVCEEYGLDSFLSKKRLKEWKRMFKGRFDENVHRDRQRSVRERRYTKSVRGK